MASNFFENFSDRLTHLYETGEARMVDVSEKVATRRQAIAGGQVRMLPTTFAAIEAGNAAKGDVLGTAKLAGIMAAKQTAQFIAWIEKLYRDSETGFLLKYFCHTGKVIAETQFLSVFILGDRFHSKTNSRQLY